MKKNIFTTIYFFILFLVFSHQLFGQKASDVIENGQPIKKGEKLFLKYDFIEKKFKSDVRENKENIDYTSMEDSIIFLIRKNAVNVYLQPLNPLNYSYTSETKVIIDPINDAALSAFSQIFETLKTVVPQNPPSSNGAINDTNTQKKYNIFFVIQSEIENIQKLLTNSQKDRILKSFESLKKISFIDEDSTIKDLNDVRDTLKKIDSYFKDIKTRIDSTKLKVKNCVYPDAFTSQFIFSYMLKDLSAMLDEQIKRLSNVQELFNLVKQMQEKASHGAGKEGPRWCIPLAEIATKEGEISIYTVTIKEDGYHISENRDIVVTIPKEEIKKSIRIRKFQRFVPEVSIGTAFTFFKYYSYGTTSDSTGQQYVGSPTENTVRNINIATMLNLNYYISNSQVHPFYQLGIGLNSGIPTILTGLGIRSNINGIKRIAISGGIAMTWLKELNQLKEGDKIKGTEDIDKDYKFSSSPKFTFYIGLQYNF